MHRDLKPANILITQNCTVKLCDFGFARSIVSESAVKTPTKIQRPMSPTCFSRFYRPPEIILQNEDYDQKSDVWSVGCVISELMTRSSQRFPQVDSTILFKGNHCFPASPPLQS